VKSIRVCAVASLAAACVMTMLAAQSAQAQTYTQKVLHTFTGGTDGANPYAALIRDAQGNFYGTTEGGGSSGFYGTVFKLDKTGKETVLYRFTGGADGGVPYDSLIEDAQGNLYGTTRLHGAYGYGVVFKLSKIGKETVLYSFCPGGGVCTDGANPYAGLIRDAKGNLYGTTFGGGASGAGTVFKLSMSGKETVRYTFTAGTDGGMPGAGLIRDAKGNLYGTTYMGGASGNGTVFKLDPTGKETVLYSFTGGTDGANPFAGLIRAKGNFYGTTTTGVANKGTVFELSHVGGKWTEKTLYAFTGGTDGANPSAGVILDAKGNIYGTTSNGGDLNSCNGLGCGVVFKLDTSGTETVLYSFTGGDDGANPVDVGVIQDVKGNLYGTTWQQGASGYGTVFKLTP